MRRSLPGFEEIFVSLDSKADAVKRVPAYSPPAR
jgi:hypothetical protein